MSFDVGADAYARFMGRYADPLAVRFADFAGVTDGAGGRVLDVGCGTGVLTAELARRVGEGRVAGIDPSASFVDAARGRLPGVDIRRGVGEDLPWPDATFDAALAQLVVHFLSDPAAGLAEMARVTRPGGTVAACVWDYAGGRAPLDTFWSAVRDMDPGARDESGLAGARAGHLAELLRRAGLDGVEQGELTVDVRYRSFDEWWEPYTLGVGPAGDHVRTLDAAGREELRRRCAQRLPSGPFTVDAVAWAARGTVRGATAD
ncbi:class I SAM-dependent methyltransferase [Nakamurella endophytica]|uniref:SAM-dependent methyltransferase n=1 Tax=Nakamurella endophytica TaxID=1748367 RepID=A0A917SMA0_9ACTN|nr:methyltransferase domain-containing protein [Nakamurella endophytica]GGL86711.1 SAM-dependent methyltransferase [Nakamurella endophytica]